jgi:hypothetical protein
VCSSPTPASIVADFSSSLIRSNIPTQRGSARDISEIRLQEIYALNDPDALIKHVYMYNSRYCVAYT